MVDGRLDNEEFREMIRKEKYPFDNAYNKASMITIAFLIIFVIFLILLNPQTGSYKLSDLSDLVINSIALSFLLFFLLFGIFIALIFNIKHLKNTNHLLRQKLSVLIYESDLNKKTNMKKSENSLRENT
jgi:hypothetical protein